MLRLRSVNAVSRVMSLITSADSSEMVSYSVAISSEAMTPRQTSLILALPSAGTLHTVLVFLSPAILANVFLRLFDMKINNDNKRLLTQLAEEQTLIQR